MPRLLLVDDDPYLLQALKRLFAADGYYCIGAMTAAQAERVVAESSAGPGFDLLIVDVGLPDADGYTLCRNLRRTVRTPILFLTARSMSSDKVLGLNLGADDYVTKPFDPAELLARVRALIRRNQEYLRPLEHEQHIQVGALVLDLKVRQVLRDGVPIPLTRREFELFQLLASHPNTALSTDWILESVWGHDVELGVKALTVCVQRLREKIEFDPKSPQLLTTLRGFGYMLTAEVPAKSAFRPARIAPIRISQGPGEGTPRSKLYSVKFRAKCA